MSAAVLNQKESFAARIQRINAGHQYEHEDIVGYQTQTRYNALKGPKDKKKAERSKSDRVMVLVALIAGIGSVLGGRLAYFHLAQMEGLPKAFYNLEGRGMILASLLFAMILIVALRLSTGGRMKALAVGCLLMHFSEAPIAANAQDVWSSLFSPEYAAQMAEQGAGYRMTRTG